MNAANKSKMLAYECRPICVTCWSFFCSYGGLFWKFWKAQILVLVAALAVLPMRAHANLISESDPRFGNNAVTLDTRTGLRWLDLPFSVGMSYDFVEAQMGVGGLFAGYRHASSAEVDGLFFSAGIPNIGGISDLSTSNNAPALNLLSFVGSTLSQNGYPGEAAYTSTMTSPGFRDREDLYCVSVNGTPEFLAGLGGGSIDSYSNPYHAHWLVEVPEPSFGCLLTCGIAALVVRGTVKKKVGSPITKR
jgi:hypothetical protein